MNTDYRTATGQELAILVLKAEGFALREASPFCWDLVVPDEWKFLYDDLQLSFYDASSENDEWGNQWLANSCLRLDEGANLAFLLNQAQKRHGAIEFTATNYVDPLKPIGASIGQMYRNDVFNGYGATTVEAFLRAICAAHEAARGKGVHCESYHG